ncbi:putative membrane-spanning protein [Bacillus sp. ZZV12-4809]|nr:putative membrane-spanning protein [Bacillus sp. ZZV12-4809]
MSVSEDVKSLHRTFKDMPKTKRIVIGSILSSLATLFHIAGGAIPIAGYFLSPLATAPVILCTIFSKSLGLAAYMVTIISLFILMPSELIIFPFTTGLLGLGIGLALHFIERRINIIVCGAFFLSMGILILLYGIQFPVLGPAISQTFHIPTVVLIFLFSIFYSWIWVVISLASLRRLAGSFR